MAVGEAIVALGAGERPASFEEFSGAIDPQWITDALAATGSRRYAAAIAAEHQRPHSPSRRGERRLRVFPTSGGGRRAR